VAEETSVAATNAAVTLLDVRNISASYGDRRGRFVRIWVTESPQPVLHDVAITIRRGECLGLVGQSGSGKTTLGNCIAGLVPLTSGEIRYRGDVVASAGRVAVLPRVRGVQVVYQDPYSALNPRRTVGSILREILLVHKLASRSTVRARCVELVEQVGLDAGVLSRRPRQLSGGIAQRVAITRALALEPELVIADEVVSALDASIQAQVLNLLADLRARTGISLLFITHDLAVVNQIADRVVVLHEGYVVEEGATDSVLRDPQHPYTRSLLAAVPSIEGGGT
jgi:peptide/nickel transport system ATP-binding protein